MDSNYFITGSEGSVFVLLNASEGMEFGIDMKCWEVGPNFRGIKMIPPGPHYVYYNFTNDSDEVVYRKGFIYAFKENEILVKKWDPKEKNISMEELSSEEIERCRSNLVELSQYLGPYPFEILTKWKSLSNHISGDLISRLTPKCGFIQVSTETVLSSIKEKKKRWIKARTDVEKHEDLLPNLIPVDGTEIRFTQLPEQRYPEGSNASEITSHYLDSTFTLQKMISSYDDPMEFLGEIQFAFICTIIGLNLEAFELWKHLIQLVCSCEKAIIRHVSFFSEFITCLSAQLEEVPMDFLVDIVISENVIYTSLRDLFRTLQTTTIRVDPRLKSKAMKFRHELTEKFGWDFDDLEIESDDEAPVIVEENEQYY